MASLWRHADFLKLWAAQAVSAFGARITREGLPMAAVLTLDATPAQLGILAALGLGPGVIVGLFAGGWIDRSRRRPLLIGADLVRMALLMTVPLAGWSGLLAMPQLYVVAALVGAAGVIFAIADHAYLPSLIGRDQLMEGNARLEATDSVAEIGGPALAGLLFQIVSASMAILGNAATYLFSAILLAFIRTPEPPLETSRKDRHPLEGLVFGVRAIWAQPLVRPLLALTVVQSLFGSFFASLYVLMAIRTLGLSTGLLGLIIAVGGIGALLGAVMAPVAVKRLGVGPAIIAMGAISAISSVLVPLSPASTASAVIFLMVAQLLGDSFAVAALIPAGALRQSVFPPAWLGRTAAVFHVARGGMSVAGALLGGLLGQVIGVRETLLVSAIGLTLAMLIPLFSPLRSLKTIPENPD